MMSISRNQMLTEQAFHLSKCPSSSKHMLHLVRCLTTTLKKCTQVFTYKGSTATSAFCPMESRAEPKVQGKKKEEYLLFVKIEVHYYKDGPNTFK
jgi:hypothetical protein